MNYQPIIIVLALIFLSTVSAKPLQDKKLENDLGSVTNKVTYDGSQWVGFTSCDLPAFFLSCDLSIHVNGQRIDANNHNADETILQSCYQDVQSIGLSINNFGYEDVQSYACLSNSTTSWSTDSAWLFAIPIIEVELPPIAKIGSSATFTCNSYTGTPLYWVLPGDASHRIAYSILENDNGVNSSSTLNFAILETDDLADFWCCAKEKPNQQTVSPCTLYTLEIQKEITLTTYESYPTDGNWSITCQFQGYPDPTDVTWTRCSALNFCFQFPSEDQLNTQEHILTSTVYLTDKSTDYYYTCSASNSLGTASNAFSFPVENNYAPIVQYNDKIFYTYGDGYVFKISFTVKANPLPNIYYNMQNFWSQSIGSTVIPAGKTGRYEVINTLIDVDTYDSSILIYDYDQSIDQATFACIAENDHGLGFAETEAEIGPSNVYLYVCDGDLHHFGETINTMLVFSGFPSPNYEISVVADNYIDYSLSEYYYSDSGITAVTVSFVATSNNPHVQINGSAFFPYILFTNQLTVDIYPIAEPTTTTPTTTTQTTTTQTTTTQPTTTGSTGTTSTEGPTTTMTTTPDTEPTTETTYTTPSTTTIPTTTTTPIPTTPPSLCPIR